MKSILVFRIGSLGDMLVAVPSLWVLRDNFPEARVTLLSDQQPDGRVTAKDVLAGSGLVDEFISYNVGTSGVLSAIRLFGKLRTRQFDAMAYLAPSYRTPAQAMRDRRFFRAAGIPVFYGMQSLQDPVRSAPRNLSIGLDQSVRNADPTPVAHEADQLLARLAHDGLRVPAAGAGNMDIRLGDTEQKQVAQWKQNLQPSGDRRWIGVGIGGKQPVNLWPESRYQNVVSSLIKRFDIWPVIFAGEAEREAGDRLLGAWGRGYNAAGALLVRAAMMAMRSCSLYVGNDTGTTHMAAAAGVPCVAIFSSRETAGLWYPYGTGHHVLRTQIECEGCRLSECIERKRECILKIQPDEAIEACSRILIRGRTD